MAGRTMRDYLYSAFFARDKQTIAAIVADAESRGLIKDAKIKDQDKDDDDKHEEPDGDEGDGHHIHLHLNGDKKTGDTVDERLASFDTRLQALDAKVSKFMDELPEALKKHQFGKKDDDGDDDTETEDELPDTEGQTAESLGSAGPELMEADPSLKTGETKMGDAAWQKRASTALNRLIADTKARAERLAPGMPMPAYDKAMSFKDAGNSVCKLRRSALTRALTGDKGLLRHVTTADIKGMSCKTVRVLFLQASDQVRDANNAQLRASGGSWTESLGPQSSFEAQRDRIRNINKRNAEVWQAQMGRTH